MGRLTTAHNVCVTRQINGEYYLEFEMPFDSAEWKLIENENLVKVNGQLYRMKTPTAKRSEDGTIAYTVRCNHVLYDAEVCKHIPKTEEIGQTPKAIMERAFADTPFRVVNPAGLKWVTERTDIEQSRLNPFKVMSTLIEKVGGELYVDNWNVAIVKQLGQKRSVRFSIGRNMKDIERQVDTSNLCARLYPYGPENLEIGEVNGGKDYIDSEYIGVYAFPYARDMDFNDLSIEDDDVLEQLKSQALKKFEGTDRIDVPKFTYKASVVALHKHMDYGDFDAYDLGDTVTIYDSTLGIETQQRIIEIKKYPYEAQSDSLTFGAASKALSSILGELVVGNEHFNSMQDRNGNIKTAFWSQCRTMKLRPLTAI